MTDLTLLEQLAQVGSYGLLLLFIILGYRGELIYRRQHDKQVSDLREYYENLIAAKDTRYSDMKATLEQRYDDMVQQKDAQYAKLEEGYLEWKKYAVEGTLQNYQLGRQAVKLAGKQSEGP